jgi:FtsP/CotA-like multicopper oxidase with cupredoxin domain
VSTSGLVALDLGIAVVTAVAWIAAGVAAGTGRTALAPTLFAAALLVTFVRIGTVAMLAAGGWWFVQEKVTVALPLLAGAGLAATLLAGPRPAVVPLLTTGYAAVAGIVVTFLVGYPAGPDDALIAAALVGVAGLVTWRLVAPDASVRRMRAGGVGVIAAGLAGAGLALVPAGNADTGGGPAGPRAAHHTAAGAAVTGLRGPATPDQGGTVRRFTLTARTTTVTAPSGRRIAAWAFNGQVPGPQITASKGDLIEVTLRNADIRQGVTLHWHGYDVPSGEDGAPGLTQNAVRPGGLFVYRFRADQTGTYWYHTHEASSLGVRMGLYGSLVVTPRTIGPGRLDLTLPVHTFGGTAAFGEPGRRPERRVPSGTPVRLRLVNTDNSPRRLTLTGTSFRLAAVDGTDLNGPSPLTRVALRLPAGGRYDLEFTMPAGGTALLVDDDRSGALRLAPNGSSAPISVTGTGAWPELDLTRYGRPAVTPYDAHSRFDRRFTLVLDRGLAVSDGLPRYAFTINGRAFPHVPTQRVRENDLVLMTVVNRGFDTHPWHLHGHHVLVLSLDGRTPAGSPLWLDTFDVRPGQVWQAAFRAGNPGLWMNHCHNLAHADQGMTMHLDYEGVTTPFHGAHAG